jgi:hypothetical protein
MSNEMVLLLIGTTSGKLYWLVILRSCWIDPVLSCSKVHMQRTDTTDSKSQETLPGTLRRLLHSLDLVLDRMDDEWSGVQPQ